MDVKHPWRYIVTIISFQKLHVNTGSNKSLILQHKNKDKICLNIAIKQDCFLFLGVNLTFLMFRMVVFIYILFSY